MGHHKRSKPYSLLDKEDIQSFREGTHTTLYKKMGAQCVVCEGIEGVCFSVWAPNAEKVSVIGSFNNWDPQIHPLYPRWDSSGIWEGFIPNLKQGDLYKYHIRTPLIETPLEKADPFAFFCETPPKTASIIYNLSYLWDEKNWEKEKKRHSAMDRPIAIYEVHLGSWKRCPEENNRSLSYLELAEQLPSYVKELGFTHVELLPIMEHPFYGSWGYQTTGYFAPTSRYGTPQELMQLIEAFHKKGIGVIFDWVPAHFPSDPHGLARFDGSCLYEHEDPKKGFHPDWKSLIFNYNRYEVRSFLLSSAHFWCECYHADGLRVDAVASMLYLDYSRKDGEWIPNEYGGNENLEALSFLRLLNETLYQRFPHIQTYAEESTAWPMVSRPTYLGGLGFGYKWNMGWMHDTLSYMKTDPIHRSYHHEELLFSLCYAFSENFVLPLSHDEVVHGKRALLDKMPGDKWQRFAHLRLLLGYLYTHPGKKLLFMGGEYGQLEEWHHETSISWHLLEQSLHKQIHRWIKDLNTFYKQESALYQLDASQEGFEWVNTSDRNNSVISFLRKSQEEKQILLVIANFTPIVRYNYKLGTKEEGVWEEVLNSDSTYYGGSNQGNYGMIKTRPLPYNGQPHTLNLTLPPLSLLILKSCG